MLGKLSGGVSSPLTYLPSQLTIDTIILNTIVVCTGLSYLVFSYLHVDDDVIDDLVNCFLHCVSVLAGLNERMHKLKHCQNQVLKPKYIT